MSNDNKDQVQPTGLRTFDANPQLLRRLRSAEQQMGASLIGIDSYEDREARIQRNLASAASKLRRVPQVA